MKKGRPSKEDVSAACRSLQDSPHTRLLYNTALLQATYLPLLEAETIEEKQEIDLLIEEVFGLGAAKEAGLIDGFLIVWKNKNNISRKPVRVVLFPPSRAGCKTGHGWERFVPRTFLREMRKYFKAYDER